MQRIIIDIYKVVYRFTGIKLLALIFSLVYITALNLVMIYGLGLLLEGWLSFMSIIHKLFAFPFIYVTSLFILGITYWLMPPLQSITKEMKKASSPVALIVYTLCSIVLFVYIKMGDKIF